MNQEMHGTTIIAVRKDGAGAMAGDGQVTMPGNNTIMKGTAKKVRRIYKGSVVVGFAGSVADAFALFDRFEQKLEETRGNLERAAVSLAKDWRTDRLLRRLEAVLIAMDKQDLLMVSGSGEVIEPDDGVLAIGSGGPYALAAARALVKHSNLTARDIAHEAMLITSQICIYTNDSITVEEV
jgi:ATP-dependent HslUV protease subunit HslV